MITICCKTINAKFIYQSLKINTLFSTKDKLPNLLKSKVIYKFNCGNCNATYVGETTWRLKCRIWEHLESNKESNIYKHLQENSPCLQKSKEESFTIIDTAPTKWQLKLKEGLHISWLKPNLNKQIKHVEKTLIV